MNSHNNYGFDEIVVGMYATYSQTITDADIKAFAGISGDNNPLHMNEEFANESRFKRRIAHGLLSASFFSALFGTQLPGPGCVYVSQNLEFLAPVYLGDTVTANITVISIDSKKNRIHFLTECLVMGKLVISGKAEIYIPRDRKIIT